MAWKIVNRCEPWMTLTKKPEVTFIYRYLHRVPKYLCSLKIKSVNFNNSRHEEGSIKGGRWSLHLKGIGNKAGRFLMTPGFFNLKKTVPQKLFPGMGLIS
jgi:hypothetical protein